MTPYEKYEYLKENFGAEEVLEELVQELSTDKLEEHMNDIAKAFDVDFDEYEEDFDEYEED